MNGDADDLSDDCDSDTGMDENDLLAVACQDEITAQLAAAGECFAISFFEFLLVVFISDS